MDSGPRCETPMREVVGDIESGLVALYLKSIPLGGGLLLRMWEATKKTGRQSKVTQASLVCSEQMCSRYARETGIKASSLQKLEIWLSCLK